MGISFWAREDSKHGNNYDVDLTNGDAIEITFVKTDEDGDLILEDNGRHPDPNTQVMIGDETYDIVFEMTGELESGRNVPEEFDGMQVAMITIIDYPETGDETRFMFLPFADASEEDMNSFGDKKFELEDPDRRPDDIPVCFVKGTLITTPEGPKPVEALQAGGRVSLAGGGSAVLRWVSRSHFDFSALSKHAGLRPVCIAADSLAPNVPAADLWVSQHHRIALKGWQVEMISGFSKVFASARHLVPAPETPGAEWAQGVEYVHLLMDQHQVLLANGAEAESLFLGPKALHSLGKDARSSLWVLLEREPASLVNYQRTALPELKAHEARTWAKMVAGEPVFRDLVAQAA
ncbi:MAG: Hint domain-containing protein [Shimia sp.]|uniref:Hint domain-containing protein n=1 Tax=Shimia sp. TaxID=1954381 RepID=UPI00405963F8